MCTCRLSTRSSADPRRPDIALRFLPRTLEGSANTGVYLEGVITRYAAADDFDVNGLTVRFDCSDPTACPNLALNGRLWIEGVLDAEGVVSIRNWAGFGDAVILGAATITAIDAQTGALTVYGSFQVQPSAITLYHDVTNIIAVELHHGDLHVGDVVTTIGDYGGVPGLLLATAINRHDPGSGGEQDSFTIYSTRFELADPAVIVLGRPILTKSTTPVDRCGEPSDTASLFSGHPDTVLIDLAAHPLDPLEATRISFTDDICSAPSR